MLAEYNGDAAGKTAKPTRIHSESSSSSDGLRIATAWLTLQLVHCNAHLRLPHLHDGCMLVARSPGSIKHIQKNHEVAHSRS
jgi:hypothetical protein